jgi:hypothetical protein
VLFAAILVWQCFLPGFIGMANNGDFAKMGGYVCIGGADNGADNFLFFVSDYLRDQRYCWDSGMWSSESWFAHFASWVERTLGDPVRFDIRWIGVFHALSFFATFGAWLLVIRPLEGYRWWLAGAALVFVLSDVSIVGYANTFYTDTSALIGAIAAVALGALLARDGLSTGRLVWFTAACFLLVMSKPTHAPAGFIPVAILLYRRTWAASVAALVILAGAVWTLAMTPAWYKVNFFTLVFFKLIPESPAPEEYGRQLGVLPEEMKYIGMHAFMPGSPVENPEWARSWSQRVTTSSLINFYLRHPGSVLRSLRHDLEEETWQRRPVNLSNFRRSEGREAGAKTKAFGWWSAVRTWLFQLWPWHIVLWYGAALALSIWRRNWILPAVLLAAGLEFAAASLTDAAETYRHLLLFQLYSDLSFLLGLILYLEYSADMLLRRKIPRSSDLSKTLP